MNKLLFFLIRILQGIISATVTYILLIFIEPKVSVFSSTRDVVWGNSTTVWGSVALMLTAYQHAAFHTGVGRHRSVWFFSLMATYFCIVALKGATDIYLLLGCGIWAFTNVTKLRPRARLKTEKRADI